MKVLVLLAMLGLGAVAMPGWGNRLASKCDPKECLLPNCRCSDHDIPGGLKPEDTPQFVLVTFEDSVNGINMEHYRKSLYNRVNPNGCPASSTFFLSHEYTDYSLVHELHANAMEIGLHSITHRSLTDYWKNASLETLHREFADQIKTINKFAHVPQKDIRGLRMPSLQMAGNNHFNMMKEAGLLYDLSWTTRPVVDSGMWPYTVDFLSTQECIIPPCPDESFPGVWVIPMISWNDQTGTICSTVDACVNVPTDKEGIKQWMIGEFNRHYKGNRAPFGFYAHSAWFDSIEDEIRLSAFIEFLDYLQKLTDVFLVSGTELIDWVRKPIPVSEMKPNSAKCKSKYTPTCVPNVCELNMGTQTRWMTICEPTCPQNYPWLSNPLGN